MMFPHIIIALLTSLVSLSTVAQRLPCPGALRTNVVNFRRELHFVCLQPTSPPRLDVIRYASHQLVQSIRVEEARPDKISSFVDDDGNLRIVLAVPDRVNGTSLYSIDRNGQDMREIHTVSTQFVDQLTTWRLQLNLEWQLAIANQPAYEPAVLHGRTINQRMPPLPDPKPIVSIYSWRSTYFDRYQLIYLPQDGHVSKLEPMHINGQEFLIVAMDSNRATDRDPNFGAGVDSLIYKLDFGSGDLDWKEFQRLQTRFSHDVKPFTLTHRASLQRDYYIAVLGRMRVTRDFHTTVRHTNVTDEEDGLIIYKYLGDEFVKTHAYPAPDMTKLEAVTYGQGDTYVIVALLSETTRQISLLSFDGLTFQRLPSPAMVPTRRPAPRQRRTMTNLQLFLAPQNLINSGQPLPSGGDGGDIIAKRTLDDNQPSPSDVPMPVLSVSDPELYPDDYDSVNVTSSSSPSSGRSAYRIPTDEIVGGDEQASDSRDPSHSKRNHILSTGPREDLLGWCKATINSVLMDSFDILSKQIQLLPRVDQNKPIELEGDLVIEDDLYISNLLYVSRVEEETTRSQQRPLVETFASNFTHTFNEIQRVHREIDEVKNRIDQILVDDGTDQNVFNQFIFDTLIVECHQPAGGGFDPRAPYLPYNPRMSCPHVTEVRTTLLNNHNISNIRRQALLTGRSMIIERDVRFEHLILQGSVNINNTLNGIPLSELVFKKGFAGKPISGHKVFKGGLYSQSSLQVGSWRGNRVDRAEFFTSSGDQTIPAMRFTQVVIDSSFNHTSLMRRLNGLDLGNHLGQIALAGADNQFEAPIEFDELVLNGPIHLVGGPARLSSIDLEELWLHTMFKQSTQNITAPIDFAGPVRVSHGGNIIVNGPVNGIWLQPREVLMRDMDYRLPNPISFEGDIVVSDLQVNRALNGIQVIFNPETRRPELSLLYNEGTQQITGDKVLSSIYLGGRSTILGNINGHLNLTQLYGLANSFGRQHHFQNIRLTGADIRLAERANINILSTINGVPANALCSLALNIYNRTNVAYKSLRFEQPISFKSLRCASINGFTDLSGTFLTKYGNQYVSGDLRLTNGAIFNTTLNIQSTLNGLHVGSLSRAISRSINETRTGRKDFFGDLYLEDLITERLNDLSLSNIFLTKADAPQIVRAPMTFDHLDIENVLKVGNLVTNSFNNLNVTNVMLNTLTYDTPQVIHNHIQLDTLQLVHGSNLHTQSVNGRNLRRIFSDAVLYDVPQQILAPKTFRGPVEFAERMFLRHTIDGLSFEDIRANLVLLSDDLIDGDLVLNNDCTIKKVLEVQSKTINDIDLDAFVSNMVRDGQPLRVAANGSIRFHDVAARDVVVGGTIQGIDLSREAIWRPRLPAQQQPPPQPPPPPPQPPMKQQNKQIMTKQQLIPHQLIMRPVQPAPPRQQQLHHLLHQPQLVQIMPALDQQLEMDSLDDLDEPSSDLRFFSLAGQHDDYTAILEANALADLAHRVNRHLSLNFYYETAQNHPLLGPLMYYAHDSLFLRATGKPGEPCLHRGQTIAIMSKAVQKFPFTQTSRIQETSNPRYMSSVANFLFILDDDPSPQVLVFTWDQKSSLYELQERVALDSPALSMKAFMSGERACLSVSSSNAIIYCQAKVGSPRLTEERTNLNMPNVIDLDVQPIVGTSQVLVAAISHQGTRLIGDLTVVMFDTQTKQLMVVATRKMIKPIKLHFFKNGLWSPEIQLAVSESITNNDNAQATSRIFSMRVAPPTTAGDGRRQQDGSHFHEVQEIRDNQFYDIQSVLLDASRTLLLFRSTHSISIYAPTNGPEHSAGCDAQYSLLQRIPTKGANKFLVFNDNNNQQQLPPPPVQQIYSNGTAAAAAAAGGGGQSGLMNHFLVLSKDQCDEKQQYSTIILRAVFK